MRRLCQHVCGIAESISCPNNPMRQIPSIEQLRQRARHQRARVRVRARAPSSTRSALRPMRCVRRACGRRAAPDDVGAALEADVPARLASLTAPSLARRHQRHRRDPPHQPRPRAAGAARRSSAWRPWPATPTSNTTSTRERAGAATSTPSGCSAICSAPRPRSWSTTTPPRRCWRWRRLAAGREVIVSRGELVEIGGGFRVPDVMAQSGAILREVGTTNRTRTADYAAAIGDRTAAILRVHPSNFRIEGFTARPDLADLVALAHRFNLPMIEDIGSGWIGRAAAAGGARRRAGAAEQHRRGRRRRPVQRRQAARRAAGGDHRRPGRADRGIRRHPLMRARARGQDDVRRARGDAAGICGGPRRRDDPGGADAGARRHRDPAPRAGADRRTARQRRRSRYWMDSRRSAAGAPQGQRSRLRWSR